MSRILNDESLNGRVAIVTGGGTGLGKAIATQFVQHGIKVVLASRRKEILEKSAQEMDPGGENTLIIPTDVRDYEQVNKMVTLTKEKFGKIDILVNNAAGNFLCPAEKLSVNGWNAVVGIVLNGTFFCSQAVGKEMIASGKGGNIINIVAAYAWTAEPGVIHSAASKAGVVAITRTLAVEWARYGIRVNAVSPGPVRTEGTDINLWQNEKIVEIVKQTVPMKRFGTKEEIANTVTFLISNYASYITGAVLTVDGAQWLGGGIWNFAEAAQKGK
jgi:NAD(P)-dependent dehydrogenase (short-subunit alcohol dehydrogenase family)